MDNNFMEIFPPKHCGKFFKSFLPLHHHIALWDSLVPCEFLQRPRIRCSPCTVSPSAVDSIRHEDSLYFIQIAKRTTFHIQTACTSCKPNHNRV